MLTDVREAILSKWPQASIHQFGSHPVGLSVFLSDLDVSVLGMGVNENENQHTVESEVVLRNASSVAVNNGLQNIAGVHKIHVIIFALCCAYK